VTNLVVPLADATSGCGGKAAHLATLVRAGLPVPDGFVLSHAAFATIAGEAGPIALDEVGRSVDRMSRAIVETQVPAGLQKAVDIRAAALGILAVRSSISIEDQPGGGAPGIYESQIEVHPRDVWSAIRAVWVSALSPLAVAYARHRGVAQVEVGVVIQTYMRGRRCTVYTRPPGHPILEEAWIEPAGATLSRVRRDDRDARLRLALAAETAIGAHGGADVELIEASTGPVVVQARPIRHAAGPSVVAELRGTITPATRVPPPQGLFAFTRRTPGQVWRWDAAHNPEPMSEAQAGLVELVDEPRRFPLMLPSAAGGRVAPYRQRVVAGYLYWTAAEEGAPAAATLRVPSSATSLRQQWARLDGKMVAALDAAGKAPKLPAALDAYLAFYRIWALEVSPLLAAARSVLPGRIANATGDADRAERLAAALSGPRTTTVAARVNAAARGVISDGELLAAIGDLAPSWDVAVPTFAETPERVRAAVERARRRPLTPPPVPLSQELATVKSILGAGLDEAVAVGRLAGDLSELDDIRFARAQSMVRRALLAAAPHGVAPADMFWLPLDEVASGAISSAENAAARASGARAAAARAATWEMPFAVVEGQPVPTASGDALRGVGTGARAIGRVVHVAGPSPVAAGAVAVVRAVTPALALALDEAAAIVAEHGGILDHGAALARELGIPCVTGCAGAWDALAEGAMVAVDGDAGTIELA
jgi:phosphohistidine swiveling domain-containing protein